MKGWIATHERAEAVGAVGMGCDSFACWQGTRGQCSACPQYSRVISLMSTGCSKVAGTLVPLALTAFTRTWSFSPELRSWIVYRVERKGSLFTSAQSVPRTNPAEHFSRDTDRRMGAHPPNSRIKPPRGETQTQKTASLRRHKQKDSSCWIWGTERKRHRREGAGLPPARSVGYQTLADAQLLSRGLLARH